LGPRDVFAGYASFAGTGRAGSGSLVQAPSGGGGGADSAPSPLSQLTGYQKQLDRSWLPVEAGQIIGIIDSALAVPAPDGSPAAIKAEAASCNAAAALYGSVSEQTYLSVQRTARAWNSGRSQAIMQAFSVLLTGLQNQQTVLSDAGKALVTWSDNLQSAQDDDSKGRSQLTSARLSLGYFQGILGDIFGTIESVADPAGFVLAVNAAWEGIASMVQGAGQAQTDGEQAASTLTKLGSEDDSWPATVTEEANAAERARDTAGFSVEVPAMQQVISMLGSTYGGLENAAKDLASQAPPSASTFGSPVAGAWSAFSSSALGKLKTASSAFGFLLNITETDIGAYSVAEQKTIDEINAKSFS
jgi:hypothetical protein